MNRLRHHKFAVSLFAFLLAITATAADKSVNVLVTSASQSIVQVALENGVSPEDAVHAMIVKAAKLRLDFIGRQRIYKRLQTGGDTVRPRLEIFQFCNLDDAHNLVAEELVFAAFMPCRIAMVEDSNHTIWLMTLNLDMVIDQQMLPPKLAELAIGLNQDMMKVLVAGATGNS
ncbi:MAG: DUF302 domain-containing protein [Thiogranum sp.]